MEGLLRGDSYAKTKKRLESPQHKDPKQRL